MFVNVSNTSLTFLLVCDIGIQTSISLRNHGTETIGLGRKL